MDINTLISQAQGLDAVDPLKLWINRFPNRTGIISDGRGNSLGRQSINFLKTLMEQANVWQLYGHDGHFQGKEPWWIYHEAFEQSIARLLGCDGDIPEAVVGNTLSMNNYMLLLEFMRICRKQNQKIGTLSLSTFFVSDPQSIKKANYTIYGSGKDDLLTMIEPDKGDLYSTEYIEEQIFNSQAGLVFMPVICHKSGQRFDIKRLARFCQKHGVFFGLDLAHGIGNIPLELSKWGVDFGTFCSYKYLNSGPGSVGGFYINKENLSYIEQSPGWWGLTKETRFGDSKNFQIAKGARRMLSSNDQIFNSVGLKTFLEALEACFPSSLDPLFAKHKKISDYTYELLSAIEGIQVITPPLWENRGCQISFRVPGNDIYDVLQFLKANSCAIEDRGDVLRTAFVSYSRYKEPALLAQLLIQYLQSK